MSAVQDVLAWWAAQLRDLLPARLCADAGQGAAVIVEEQAGGLVLHERGGRRERRVGALETPQARAVLASRRGARLLLRVPGSAVLERPLSLPLAAETALDSIVAHEIDRISPFAATEVAWTYAVERRDRAAGRLELRIALLPRAAVAEAVGRLRDLGATATSVLAPRSTGGDWRIDLAAAGRPRRRGANARTAAALAAACALLAASSAALPFVLQYTAIHHEEDRIAQLRPQVAQVEALRRQVAGRAGALDVVAAESARAGQVLNVLATLTTLLPDNTHLTSLGLRQRVLTLAGRSASAARLIPLLSADPAFGNAGFAAPVTRAEGVQGDVFSIRVEFGS